jgi:hypothetical protein
MNFKRICREETADEIMWTTETKWPFITVMLVDKLRDIGEHCNGYRVLVASGQDT